MIIGPGSFPRTESRFALQVRVNKPSKPRKDLSDAEMMNFHMEALSQQLKQVLKDLALHHPAPQTPPIAVLHINSGIIPMPSRDWSSLKCSTPGKLIHVARRNLLAEMPGCNFLQVRAGIAFAVAFERTLILPELICYCDRSW